jgi:hypothetical protein
MIFAARKLQGIGLILLLTAFALFAYTINVSVSATRTELQQVEQQIVETQRRNRMLEGDIAVLANAHQLDRWNRDYFGLVAPGAGQYLSGERELASLDRLRPARNASVDAPVLVAMATAAPAGGSTSPAAAAPDRVRMTNVALNDIAAAATPLVTAAAQ